MEIINENQKLPRASPVSMEQLPSLTPRHSVGAPVGALAPARLLLLLLCLDVRWDELRRFAIQGRGAGLHVHRQSTTVTAVPGGCSYLAVCVRAYM